MRGVSTILCVVILSISCHFYDAALTEAPTSTAAVAGTTFQLRCAFDNTSTGDTNWQFTSLTGSTARITYRCGVLPDYTGNYTVVSTPEGGCHLNVLNPTRSSAGTYTCSNGFEEAPAANVVVLDSTPNCQANRTSDLLSGEFIQITCLVGYTGRFSPKMRWNVSDTGAPITNDTTTTFPNSINSYIVVPVFPPTTRPYVCETYFDPPITYSYSWTLPPINIQYFIQRVFAQTRIHYFNEAQLVCSGNGYPPPSYVWINLNTGFATAGSTVNVHANGVSLFACNASNTIRGETVTLQVGVSTNITQDIPEGCPSMEPPTGTVETTPDPTTPTTPAPTTTTIPTTTTTTPEPIGPCGRLLNVVPSPPGGPAVPSNWTGMCYISQNNTNLLTTTCRNLISDLPPGYANYNELLAAGGNFGCYISTRSDYLLAASACEDNKDQTAILASCPSCPRLFLCFRLPAPPAIN